MKSIFFLAASALCVLTWCSVAANPQYQDDYQSHWWDTDDNDLYSGNQKKRVPFPQCLVAGAKSHLFDSSSFQRLFDKEIRKQEDNLKYEGYENDRHHNDGTMNDDDNYGSQRSGSKSRATALAAVKLTRNIMTALMCDLNDTDTENLNGILNKFTVPEELCSYRDMVDCDDKKTYRTATGVCNNLQRPYEGSSQTAYGRIHPAVYQDRLSEPRRKSVRGGRLPGCREISLALGSQPIFDRHYTNFFVIFGQMMGHDVALSLPVSDTYSRPISSCQCDDKYDWDKCNVIDVAPDDPYLRGQKCMAFPATTQAFKNQVCSLGVKEQMNANTHALDLSPLYGSTVKNSNAVRSTDGKMKSTRPQWSLYEMPPAQREGKSCVDETYRRKCLTGGDSRLMINLLFTGIQTIFLRFHNRLAEDIHKKFPNWESNKVYEEARRFTIAMYQRIGYEYWLPILFGNEKYKKEFGEIGATKYNETAPFVVKNEFATAAFRLHSLVRDLFSRCDYDGNRIDQLWLHDILHKVKYAYDNDNNGLDSILCGSFYDYGFSFDGNFAHQIRNRLFESTNSYGYTWRNDLVSINICRGREHGLATYNSLRKHCGLDKADNFEDFGDHINYQGINTLKKLYKSPDDVDLFVGLNLEDPISGGIIGPTSVCIIADQFRALRDGDRLFYFHNGVFKPTELAAIRDFPFHCLICNNAEIKEVPQNPFRPPNDDTNPLKLCSECAPFTYPQ